MISDHDCVQRGVGPCSMADKPEAQGDRSLSVRKKLVMIKPFRRAVVLLVLARSPRGVPQPPEDFRLVLVPFLKVLFPHCRRVA